MIDRYKNDEHTSKNGFLIEKTMKPYSKVMILSLKNYENISKCNSKILPIRYIDCLGKYFEVVIYR